MNGYLAFVKKELMENARNYRMLLMLILFSLFGIMSPLFAKFTPQIIEAVLPNIQDAFEVPTPIDSWTQFYKNVSQLGLSLTIILFSNCLSSEYTKGTLTIMLTKGLSRPAVVLSKFSAAAIITTISYWVCFGITFGYTAYLWPGMALPHILFAAVALWLTALLYLCILLLGCVLFKQAFTAILFLLVVTATMSLLGVTEQFANYSPSILASKNVDLIAGKVSVSEFTVPIIITVIISIFLLTLAVIMFKRKQI